MPDSCTQVLGLIQRKCEPEASVIRWMLILTKYNNIIHTNTIKKKKKRLGKGGVFFELCTSTVDLIVLQLYNITNKLSCLNEYTKTLLAELQLCAYNLTRQWGEQREDDQFPVAESLLLTTNPCHVDFTALTLEHAPFFAFLLSWLPVSSLASADPPTKYASPFLLSSATFFVG